MPKNKNELLRDLELMNLEIQKDDLITEAEWEGSKFGKPKEEVELKCGVIMEQYRNIVQRIHDDFNL